MEIRYDIFSPVTYNLVFPFCVSINGHDFPYDDWDDFVFPMMIDWILCMEELNKVHQGKQELFFMDGPYYILCEREYQTVKISGCHLDKGNLGWEEVCEFQDLYQMIWQIGIEMVQKISLITPDIIENNRDVHCLFEIVNGQKKG